MIQHSSKKARVWIWSYTFLYICIQAIFTWYIKYCQESRISFWWNHGILVLNKEMIYEFL